jgi:predicted DNA-binding transcriptional regulator YafY
MNLSRLRRLLQLISLLQGGRQHNTEALAKACEVSRRTIFRDLDTLRTAGVPLVYDESRQRYHIPGTYYLPPTNFTPEEAMALVVLCHDLGTQLPAPFFKPVRNAALKLENALPVRLREQVRTGTSAVQVQMVPINPLCGQESTCDLVLSAITARQSVRITYRSLAEEKEICTRLHPYRLLFSRRSWYVIGRSSLHRGTRTFNLGRILRIELLEDGYEIPHGFSVERYLRNAWHLIPESGADREVVVRFRKKVAQNVAEVAWHKTQRLELLPDGTMDFHVTVSGLGEISWWILGYGDQAEVLEPPELRRIVAGHAARMLAYYPEPAGAEVPGPHWGRGVESREKIVDGRQ